MRRPASRLKTGVEASGAQVRRQDESNSGDAPTTGFVDGCASETPGPDNDRNYRIIQGLLLDKRRER
jgi:hypothetical protein